MALKTRAQRNGLLTRLASSWASSCFLLCYAACLFGLLTRLPLWLDEIVDLKGIRDYDFSHLIAWIPVNAGGTPLGYLTRFVTVHLLGYSTFSGRLPSLIFSVWACVGVVVLARRLQLRLPILALVFFALVPLQLRYALESRPYSLALALTVWATVAFLRLCERGTAGRAFFYGLLVLCGLYTQPYSVFVPIAHLVWLFSLGRRLREKRQLALVSTLAVSFAALGFLPWYGWTAQAWNQSVSTGHLRYMIEPKAPLLIARELTGAGYLGTALLVTAAFLGLRFQLPQHQQRLFWTLYALLPIVLAVLADGLFGYFLAIRQMIFVLAPLTLLAALGMEKLAEKRRRTAVLAVGAIVAVFLVQDVRFFLRPRENWSAASRLLKDLADGGSCVVFEPPASKSLYQFFVPQLARASCDEQFQNARAVAVAISPYGPQQDPALAQKLSQIGLHKLRELNRNGPRVEVFGR